MTPVELVGLLAEPERLRVVAALVLGARTPSELAQVTALEPRSVAAALHRLQAGGLVVADGGGFVLASGLFKQVARAAAPRQQPEEHGYADPQVAATVRAFVRDGRLVGLPAQHGRRRRVLEHVVASFEPGVHYPEREVDAVLRAWCAGGAVDHVALRRYLIDEELLARESGRYWRTGGWMDVPVERC